MNVLVRVAPEASPPRDLGLRRDVRKQTPSGRITRLITARSRAAQRPPPLSSQKRAGCGKEGGGFRHQLRAALILITTRECRRQLLGFCFFVFFCLASTGTSATHATSGSETWRPVATHGIGLSLWIMSAIKERKRGGGGHLRLHTQPDLNNHSWQILLACRWPRCRARLRASGLAGRCGRPCLTFGLLKQSQTSHLFVLVSQFLLQPHSLSSLWIAQK